MDWKTIIMSISSSTVVAAITVFLLKRFIDRSIQHHFLKREKAYETLLSLRGNRWERITKEQSALYKMTLSQIYVFRNTYRDALKDLAEGRNADFENPTSAMKELFATMEKNRALYHPAVWSLVHEFANQKLILHAYDLMKSRTSLSDLIAQYKSSYQRIDDLYRFATILIQDLIGVNDNPLNPNKTED